jgi:molybdopterin-guanine dinucleotide biosynthesis protein A
MIDPKSISAYILAGGRSSRFGSDKARAIVNGQPLIVRVAEGMRRMFRQVWSVARRADEYEDLGIGTIADLKPGCGPLSGLHAALHHADTPWILLASCDWVVLEPKWLTALVRAIDADAGAVAYRHAHWEPLLALYARSALPVVESHLQSGRLAMQQLLDALRTVALPLPTDWPANAQVNTPEELQAYLSQQRR